MLADRIDLLIRGILEGQEVHIVNSLCSDAATATAILFPRGFGVYKEFYPHLFGHYILYCFGEKPQAVVFYLVRPLAVTSVDCVFECHGLSFILPRGYKLEGAIVGILAITGEISDGVKASIVSIKAPHRIGCFIEDFGDDGARSAHHSKEITCGDVVRLCLYNRL